MNVPNSHASFNHVIPPPLPPRRRERKEGVPDAHLAQKRQAPDAPQVIIIL